MSEYDFWHDYDPEPGDEDLLVCKRCGEPELHWQGIIKADGTPGYALFNHRNRKHVCGQPDVNDFPVLK
jgi:hypothetical protein